MGITAPENLIKIKPSITEIERAVIKDLQMLARKW